MKNTYETPVAEVISFIALEQMATLSNEPRLAFGNDNFEPGLGSRNSF